MDRRYQLVLDCLDCEEPPFSKGTLVAHRRRRIESGLDRRLVERTVEVAEQQGGFGARQLRAALDSSPLWGASRVEDTYNLLGHALRKAMGVVARQQRRGQAGLNWDDPAEQGRGLAEVLKALEGLEQWLAEHPDLSADPVLSESLATAQQVRDQNVEMGSDGNAVLRQGVAEDRRIAVEDADMRHGRKSSSQRIDGYKRHLLRDLDTGLVRAAGVTPANAPEASVTDDIMADLAAQGVLLKELHIDRAYLSSPPACCRQAGTGASCRPGDLLQGLASTQRRSLSQDSLSVGLGTRTHPLSERYRTALRTREPGAIPSRELRGVQQTRAVYQEPTRTRRTHSSR